MYTDAFGDLSGGRSWCTAGAMTSTRPYVSYPSNIQPSQDAISALRLALLIEDVQDATAVRPVICSCRYTTLNKGKVWLLASEPVSRRSELLRLFLLVIVLFSACST